MLLIFEKMHITKRETNPPESEYIKAEGDEKSKADSNMQDPILFREQ